jgi:hypothetical protein
MSQLNKMALGTFGNGKRAMEFGLGRIGLTRKIVRKGLGSEIQESLPQRGIAIAARFSSMRIVRHKRFKPLAAEKLR